MNNNHRDEMDELKLAEQTARVLESGDCNDRDDAATYELGRLLRQSANHELPESNEDLREQLLMELAEGGDAPAVAPMVATKESLNESSSRVSRKRLWMGVAAGAMVAVGGWWLYQPQHGVVLDGNSEMVGQLDLTDFPATAPVAPRQDGKWEEFGAALGIEGNAKLDETYAETVDKMSAALRSANENAFDKSKESYRIPTEAEQKIASLTDRLDERTKAIALVEQGLARDKGQLVDNGDGKNSEWMMRQSAGEGQQVEQIVAKGEAKRKNLTMSVYGDLDVVVDESKSGSINIGGAYNTDNGKPVRFQAAVPGGIKEQQFRRPALFGAPADGYAVHERYARRPSLEPDRYALDVDGETQTEQLRRRSIKSYTAGKVNSTWFDEDGNDKSEFVNELRKYEANFKNRFEVANAKRKELEKNYNALELSDGSNIHSMMVTELAKSMQATRQQLAELQNEKAKNERAEAVGSEGIEARVWAMQQDRYLSKSPQRGVQTSAIKMRLLESEANAELVRQKVGTGHPDYEAAIGTVKIIEQQLAETKKGIAAPSVDDAIAPEVVFARKKSEVEQKIKDLTRSLTEQDEQWTLHNKEAMRLSKAKQELASLDAELAEIREAQRLGGEMLLKLDSTGEREQYAPIYENQFVQATGGAAVSTFSIDVDTASYANMRRFLNSGQMPPRDSIRIEELVNYFQYDYPQPKGDDPFSVNMELATCPWNDAHKLLRVGLKGKEVHVKERPATNVVYLIDVSGSMSSNDKLPLLKRGFQMMTKQLGKNDRVSIVTYAGNAGVALKPTTGDKTETINEAIENLTSGGSTHGSAGIELAYKLAQQHFITGGVNKVILATDGDLNVGVTADGALVKLIKQKASEGVFLTVLGFGTGNLQDGKLEKLADNGNGHYAYIDSNREAHRVLVQQVSGSLVTIAKDVKIQIEFNPAEVKSYRLVGYENRMLETKDFDDDRKDAGEIGAGHTVTAIYEIEPMSSVKASFTAPKGMKYQTVEEDPAKSMMKTMRHLTGAATTGELATLALRYKKPDENESKRIEFAIKNDEKSFTSASDDFRFAASVAGFGMLLRGSEHAGDANPAMILEMASDSMGEDTTGYRAEFIDLVRPFVPKDHILGAAFKRDDTVAIALGGFFDLDGDGVSDLEKLKRMLARNGGRVVAFHDENGKVIGKIEATTRFFVLGPTPRSGSPEVFETMAKMKEQAEAKSVEVIDLRKLLNWTGIPGSSKIERMDSRIGENTGFESRSTAEK